MACIMIVEDDKDLAWTMSQTLKLAGYETVVAGNGEEALRTLERQLPDIVISDLEMPVLDGEGLATRMFFEDCGKEDIPILVVSGFPDIENVARRIGTPYFVPKPYGFDEFLGLIERILQERIAPNPPEPGAPPESKCS
jgi:DNA-binding NtrC family response regulator